MTRLGELLDDAIGPVDPGFDVGDVMTRARKRHRTRARRSVGGAVVIALVAAATVVIVRSGDDPARKLHVAPAEEPAVPTDVVAFDDGGGFLAVDYTTRVATHHPIDGARGGDQPFHTLRVGDDVVVGWGDVYAAPITGGPSRKLGTGVFVPAVEPGAVWLTSYGQVQTPTERLVDMQGHVLLEGPTPRQNGQEVAAITGVPGGLLMYTPTGAEIWDARTGRFTRHVGTAVGLTALPVSGSHLAWCDHCTHTIELTDLTTGTTHAVTVDTHGGDLVLERFVGFSPDGTQLAVPVQPDAAAPVGATTKIVVVDVATATIVHEIDAHARYATVAWSGDSKRLYIAATDSGSGGRLLVHDPAAGTTRDLGPVPDAAGSISMVLTAAGAARLPSATPGAVEQCRPAPTVPPPTAGNGSLCAYRF